jgi:hypothetical protein
MEVPDSIYSFEIARRSVGRAALHLGIENMSETALDVMADVLLNYLSRVGKTLSHLVETNGRTSAHVNILDAFRACEMEASPAVQQLHLRDPHQDDQLYTTVAAALDNSNTRDWKGLASFLYGPKWLDEKEEEQLPNEPAGGKHFPSSTGDEKTKPGQGWQAPYLDEVPQFPQASKTCANPHPLAPQVGLSLHRAKEEIDESNAESAEIELQNIPDDIFIGSWGSMTSKRKKRVMISDASEDVEMIDAAKDSSSPAAKKIKLSNGNGAKLTKREKSEADKKKEESTEPNIPQTSHPHVPSFYPEPPSVKATAKESRKVLDIESMPEQQFKEEILSEGSHGVRSSLVQLGSYWGSGWDAPTVNTKLAVPLGRREGEQRSAIVPLGRASGSRVSRILEGSMDAATMQ